jgi:shikimate kinase
VRVLLVGLPGSGATTVGGLLAKRLGWPFLDDSALLERTGSPSRALTLVLGMPGQLVAALPAECVDDPADRARIAAADSHVVWLRCSIPVLARRLGSAFGDDPTAALRRLNAERGPVYEELASQVVDTDAMPAGQVANLVIQAVGVSGA